MPAGTPPSSLCLTPPCAPRAPSSIRRPQPYTLALSHFQRETPKRSGTKPQVGIARIFSASVELTRIHRLGWGKALKMRSRIGGQVGRWPCSRRMWHREKAILRSRPMEGNKTSPRNWGRALRRALRSSPTAVSKSVSSLWSSMTGDQSAPFMLPFVPSRACTAAMGTLTVPAALPAFPHGL